MKEKYYEQAVTCVKDTVLPAQIKLYKSCGGDVQSGQVTDLDQCECSRQSILYILSCLEPDSKFEVEILETILRGAEHCRFQITKY